MADIVGIKNHLYAIPLLYEVASKKPQSVLIVSKYDDGEVVVSWSAQTNEELAHKAMCGMNEVMHEMALPKP